MKVTGSSGLKLNALANAGFLGEPIPEVALIDSLEAGNAFEVWDSKSFKALDTFFPLSSEMDIHPTSLSDLDIYERASSILHAEKAWSIEREGEKDRGRDQDRHHDTAKDSPMLVPEPGSLLLLLLGLAAVGFLGRRRG